LEECYDGKDVHFTGMMMMNCVEYEGSNIRLSELLAPRNRN